MSGPAVYEQIGLPFQRHSDESRTAAERIRERSPVLRGQVYAVIATADEGRTDEEGAAILHMNGNTYRPRRIELQRLGLIVARGSRLTKAGRPAAVWYAAGAKGADDAGTE
jgi:cytosine/adenosine deaminase-related metal-dependent hydrolase